METKPKIIYQIYRKRVPGSRKKIIQYGVAFKFDTEAEREIFKENVKLCYEDLIKNQNEPKVEKTEVTGAPDVEEEKPKRGRPRKDVQGQ